MTAVPIGGPIRVLFNSWADATNVGSQSLTAREIARRLDPDRCRAALFLGASGRPDPRLGNRVDLIRMPPRLGSAVILRHLLWGRRDVIFYPALNPRAARHFLRLRRLARPVKLVQCLEGSWGQLCAAPPAVRELTVRALRAADLVTGITPAIVRDLIAQGYRAELMPLGVDLDVFHPPRTDSADGTDGADSADSRPRVVFVGSIQERKGVHLVLELARRHPDVDFDLIGPDLGDLEYGRRLRQETVRDRLDRVVFHGPLPQVEIARRLRASDVYVLPSRREGFGKTTLEAAACGLPAVVFSDYETTAVVDGETGYAVPTFDAMYDRVAALLTDPALRARLGRAAADHARAFGWDAVAASWQAHFLRLAAVG